MWRGEEGVRLHLRMWVEVTMGLPTTFPLLGGSIFTGPFVRLHHVLTVKQAAGSAGGTQVKHWGNLLFRPRTGASDWCSHAGSAAAVRNLPCLPAHFQVPDLVTAFSCHKPHRKYIRQHTAEPGPSQRDSPSYLSRLPRVERSLKTSQCHLLSQDG